MSEDLRKIVSKIRKYKIKLDEEGAENREIYRIKLDHYGKKLKKMEKMIGGGAEEEKVAFDELERSVTKLTGMLNENALEEINRKMYTNELRSFVDRLKGTVDEMNREREDGERDFEEYQKMLKDIEGKLGIIKNRIASFNLLVSG